MTIPHIRTLAQGRLKPHSEHAPALASMGRLAGSGASTMSQSTLGLRSKDGNEFRG